MLIQEIVGHAWNLGNTSVTVPFFIVSFIETCGRVRDSRADQIVPVNASREIVAAVAAARNVVPNVGVAAGAGDVVGGSSLNASWATDGGHEGWTKDVAVGLRYTELQHASHNLCAAPLFDKGMAAPLFEWTLEQLRAAGFEGDKYSVA